MHHAPLHMNCATVKRHTTAAANGTGSAAPGEQACIDTCNNASDVGFVGFYAGSGTTGEAVRAGYYGGNAPACTNPNSYCQPTGAIGDPSTFGACIPGTSSCGAENVALSGDTTAACPQGSFQCSDSVCQTPSVLPCINGYKCTNAGDFGSACADDDDCDGSAGSCLPTFSETGTACSVNWDGNTTTTPDAEMGWCTPTGEGSLDWAVTACLPDCATTSCGASAGTATTYCAGIEAVGTGALNGGIGNTAYPYDSGADKAVCAPASAACGSDADCSVSTAVQCGADSTCQPPSIANCTGAISASGPFAGLNGATVPGGAGAGTPCDAFNAVASDTSTGYCVPSADLAGDLGTIGDGDNDLAACLVRCTPDGGAGDCKTAGAVCADFTGGGGLYVCVPMP